MTVQKYDKDLGARQGARGAGGETLGSEVGQQKNAERLTELSQPSNRAKIRKFSRGGSESN